MFPTSIKILVVDDMAAIRQMVRSQLKSMGYNLITEAENGEAALKLIQESLSTGLYGLVICDWNMPRKTGLQLLKDVRADGRLQNLPFILLTSEAEREQVTEAVMAGVSQYIIKPFTPQLFVEKMSSAWKKHQVI